MPAVLVHGVPDTSLLWGGVRSGLSRTDVVTPNLPGFDAPLPAGFDATKEAYVAWLIETLEAIGEPVDLVGHDWGGLLVLRVVSTRRDLIRTWASGSGPCDRKYVWHEVARLWQTPEVGEQIMAGMTPQALEVGLAEQMGPDAAAQVAAHLDETMKSCILSLYRSAVDVNQEWADQVDTITTPGVVFWGADDLYVTRDFGERLAQRTGARLVMFDTGHWWPRTKSVEVARELEALWSSV